MHVLPSVLFCCTIRSNSEAKLPLRLESAGIPLAPDSGRKGTRTPQNATWSIELHDGYWV
jgi:hypothetical protein